MEHEINTAMEGLRSYDFGRSTDWPWAVERLVNDTHGQPDLRRRLESELAMALDSDASVAAKQFICEKLWIIGTEASVPAVARALASRDTHIVEAACYALSSQTHPAAGKALREALGKARGLSLVAVINQIGDRRDRKSTTRLGVLATDSDPAIAEAAIAALGKIGTQDAARTLSRLSNGLDAGRSVAAAHALLQCGGELGRYGKASDASAVYLRLSNSSGNPSIRRGATLALERLRKQE